MNKNENTALLSGVMLNAYPDSIGKNLSDTIRMLKMPEFKDAFSLFYILPTFFNSDLDRGFSIIDYNINKDLVSKEDLEILDRLNIMLKFDIVLNHLSVASPQFKDLLKHGENSKYKDFFINWNSFWEGHGTINEEGVIIPKEEFLSKLFMRKSGLPILKVPFSNGKMQPYWNTFYQKITYNKISVEDLQHIKELKQTDISTIVTKVNDAIENNEAIHTLDFKIEKTIKDKVIGAVNQKCTFLGQMDVNAKSGLVWEFYEETLAKLKRFGCKILRLDAFAYLHKEVGQTNFFNTPGTWDYLEKINQIAVKNNLILLPEIHAEYGLNLHDEVASKGYTIYDFFLPGLMIHTLEKKTNNALYKWITDIQQKGYKTVNMLGCHDGIPVLDLKGKQINGTYNNGLLPDKDIEHIMETIIARGGRVKNLYDADGNKISYYQVNATFYSALGEDDAKMLLARAIQMFMPGIPQVWYLDLFVGTNDYEAVEKAGEGGHKEINRTTLSLKEIEERLKLDVVKKQLEIIRLRNTSKAFLGNFKIEATTNDLIHLSWRNNSHSVKLEANLNDYKFKIYSSDSDSTDALQF
ncbi:maltooligosyl trehalose synthase [Winogradskyella wandonensis]|uniref:Maltooligosyl trehalose synthase n=1 Tax=Winogradskyella wandonensis TaxID=1442586 RepID=A0A4R1KRC6_9FLAO|nr:glycosidase [Winogradskyella wandonensis]TCK67574.1 maltooligosyl trehalose synthase [Winogradskyella wandonensis]